MIVAHPTRPVKLRYGACVKLCGVMSAMTVGSGLRIVVSVDLVSVNQGVANISGDCVGHSRSCCACGNG